MYINFLSHVNVYVTHLQISIAQMSVYNVAQLIANSSSLVTIYASNNCYCYGCLI